MILLKDKSHLQEWRNALSPNQLPIGFVPTMGALHAGHASLFQKAREECKTVIASIFVNPLQFNNPEDLASYPRVLDKDLLFLERLNVDALYSPDPEQFYKEKPLVSFDFGNAGQVMEGYYRPGHFNGVAIVISKLFNQVRPDSAYFGLKDFQQYILIKRLVTDLSFNVTIRPVETVREQSGLALSSRNMRLSDEGKKKAEAIYQGLNLGASLIKKNKKITQVKQEISLFLRAQQGIELEYCEIVNVETLNSIDFYNSTTDIAICIAAYVEGVRLIDNLYLQNIS